MKPKETRTIKLHKTSPVAFISILAILTIFSSCCLTPPPEKDSAPREDSQRNYNIAIKHLRDEKYRKAEESIRKAIAANTQDPQYYNVLGLSLAYQEKYHDALSAYQKALSLDPSLPTVYNHMGWAYAKLKQWDKAIEAYQKTLSFKSYPTPERAIFNIANAYREQGKFQEAINEYHRAISLNPQALDPHIHLASLYKKNKEYQKAIDSLNNALKIFEDNPSVYYELGLLYKDMGKNQEAIAAFEKVRLYAPDSDLSYLAAKYLELLRN